MTSTIAQFTPAIDSVCAGTPYEMGHAQGVALAGKLHSAVETLAELEAFRNQQPWWMPYPLFRRIAERRASRYLGSEFEREFPPAAQRMSGLADGAKLPLSTVKLLNSMEPLLSAMGDKTVSGGACSAVAVRGAASANGEPMVGRNFDYLPIVRPFYTLRDSRPVNGRRAIEFTSAPLVGAVDGINESGLTITYDYAFTIDEPDRAVPPISVAISDALASCDTVSEAIQFIENSSRWGAGLLMLADADGDIASLELSSTRSAVRRPEPGQDVVHHSNCFRCAATRDVQLPDDAVYSDKAPLKMRGRRLHHSSEVRDDRYAELLAKELPVSDTDLLRIMSDHGPDNQPDDYTVCVHGSYWETTSTMQYFPQRKLMRASYTMACIADFKEFSL